MIRRDGREPGGLRPVAINGHINPYAEGSALCAFGRTEVLCTASLEEGAPPHAEARGMGWVTAEYAMLPRSTHTRTSRDSSRGGRAREISRLIGRSLRAAVDLTALAGHTVRVDCDVMVADGGTRTAAITGGWVALALALKRLGQRPAMQLAAISVGRVAGELLTDLCYEEDSSAEVDANLVLAPGQRLVEVQATAEKGWFGPVEMGALLDMAFTAGEVLFKAQARVLDEEG